MWECGFFNTKERAFSFATLIKKENQIFLIYKEIQMGAVAKSYMRKGFLLYMRKRANIYSYMRRP